jgi:hypothetical protein
VLAAFLAALLAARVVAQSRRVPGTIRVQVQERYKKYHDGVESRMALRFSGLAAIYGSKEIPKNLQPDIDKVFVVPGAVNARHLPPGSVTNAGRIAGPSNLARARSAACLRCRACGISR